MIRIEGTDTAHGSPSGFAGYPRPQANNFDVTHPLINDGDTTSRVQGLGQLYFLAMPVVAVLGGVNANGEQRIDHNYPGYNFNISDQRRAKEFIADFDRMVTANSLPQFLYIYQPNDHTGTAQAANAAAVPAIPIQFFPV